MAYTKTTWTDEVLAGAERFNILSGAGSSLYNGVQINLSTAVTVAGTSMDAAVMNNIEDGIDALDTLLSSIRDAATELTIASDAITITQSNHKLQPQSGTADDLSTISGTVAGQSGILYASDYGTDTITILHNVGNILCMGDSDIELSNGAVLWYSDGTKIFAVGGGSAGLVHNSVCDGRLTLESGVPVSVSAQTSKTELFWTPFIGDRIALLNEATWEMYQSPEISILATDAQDGTTTNGSAVITGMTDTSQLIVGMTVSGAGIAGGSTIASVDSATQITLSANATASATVTITSKIPASSQCDVFMVLEGESGVLRFGPIWTDGVTRATALTRQDGVPCLTGFTSWKHLGLIRTDAVAGQISVNSTVCGVSNFYNPVVRRLYCEELTSHTYNGANRLWNNSEVNNRLDYISCVDREANATLLTSTKAGADASYAFTGIYLNGDRLNQYSAALSNYNVQYIRSSVSKPFALVPGYGYLNAYENGNHASSSFNVMGLSLELLA